MGELKIIVKDSEGNLKNGFLQSRVGGKVEKFELDLSAKTKELNDMWVASKRLK